MIKTSWTYMYTYSIIVVQLINTTVPMRQKVADKQSVQRIMSYSGSSF